MKHGAASNDLGGERAGAPGMVDGPNARQVLTHHRLLGARMFLHVQLRLAAAGLIAVVATIGRAVSEISSTDATALLGLAVALVAYNGVAYALTLRSRRAEASVESQQRLRSVMRVVIVCDFLALTVAVWLFGGARSPILAFYLLHVVLACLLMTRREAMTIAVLAYALIVALVVVEWSGLLAPGIGFGAGADTVPIDWRLALMVLAIYGVLITVAVFLVASLSGHLRAGEEALRVANVELDRESNLRRDFLHLALHDIQAMVGVVAANLRNMEAGLGGELSEKHRTWVETSLRRLDGVNQFLEEFRMLETLGTEPIEARLRPVDLGVMLEELVAAHRDQAEAHRHTLELDVARALPAVRAIPELLREAIANYVTNAIKYTPDGGRITLRAFRRARNVRVEVEDSGIGIAPEDISKLFADFVRLDCSQTPVAGVRGTGLGLSIVRRIMERMGGKTGVRSRRGEGSTFLLELPASDERGPGAGAASPATERVTTRPQGS